MPIPPNLSIIKKPDMEELKSTENLEREILEDARKKAQRILKTADDSVKNKAAEWDKKTTEALKELEKKFAEQGRLALDEIMAVLPMDKRRAKAEKIESLLRSAVETWYAGLSREKVLGLIKKELAKRLAVCREFAAAGGGQYLAGIYKITRAEAESVLEEVLPGKPCQIEEAQSVSHRKHDGYPEFILENDDVRIYASIGKTVDFLLHKERAGLIEALLGDTESLC